jgi:hypothetical protein
MGNLASKLLATGPETQTGEKGNKKKTKKGKKTPPPHPHDQGGAGDASSCSEQRLAARGHDEITVSTERGAGEIAYEMAISLAFDFTC